MKKFVQTAQQQGKSFFTAPAKIPPPSFSLLYLFQASMVYRGGGFKNPKQGKSLLVLALLANQNAIGAGDTLHLGTAHCRLQTAASEIAAPRNCKPLPSTRQSNWRVQAWCNTPLKMATLVPAVASTTKSPFLLAICMVST